MAMVSFALSSQPELLARAVPVLSWIIILLSIIMSLPSLFQQDEEEGLLDQWRLLPLAMEWVVVARLLAQWLGVVMPLNVLAMSTSWVLGMTSAQALDLAVAQSLGAISTLALGALSAALLTGQRHRAPLMMLLVLPLLLPIMLFGLGASDSAATAGSPLLMLLGIAMLSVPISVLACASLLRE